LLPSALSYRQTHVWPDEVIEDLKDEHLPFKFLLYLRSRQCPPYQRAQTVPQREVKPLDVGRIYRLTGILQFADESRNLLQRMATYHLFINP